MAGVFGTPVTVETVRASGEYPEPITQKKCAEYAMNMMNAGGKDLDAVKYVENLKDRYGYGITTKCLIYNATGTTLYLAEYCDWHGHIHECPYPAVIQNGQWGAFIHVHASGCAVGSAGAVVYRSKSPPCDLLFSWSIPFAGGSNRVYTDIRAQDFFKSRYESWENIYHNKLEESSRHSVGEGFRYKADATIGESTTVEARAYFTYP